MFSISSSDESSMDLKNLDIPVESLVQKIGDVLFIPTAYYNDIALLSLDWLSILSRLSVLAQNRRVIFLFNSLNSFSVRYTVSKLGTVGKLFIFAQSNPVVLVSLLSDINFIPEGRFRIVLMKYIKTAESIAKHISSKHSVSAFSGAIDWGNPKLGIV
jgi:hypothetical protein